MPPKKEEGDPLAALGLQVPKLDEGKLLADCRSPRFFKACQKLQIDPLDLRPRELETFEEAGSSPAKGKKRRPKKAEATTPENASMTDDDATTPNAGKRRR